MAKCGGRTYYYIENGNAYDGGMPKCVFLAGFDPLLLGHEKKESLYLEPIYLRRVFNLAGMVMPCVLLSGRVVGRWKKKGKRLSMECFESLSQSDIREITDKAQTLWPDIDKIDFGE